MRHARAFFALFLTVAVVNCGGGGATIGPTGPQPASSPSSGSTLPPGASPSPSPSASASSAPIASNACGGTNAAEPAIPFPSSTDADAFYAQPKPFPNSAPGTVLASRPVTFQPDGTTMQNTAYQIKSVSCDVLNEPIAAVATVVLPSTPNVAGGAEPLFVENFAEDSLGPKCAPSHSVTGSTAANNANLESPVSILALNAGWTVLYPDYEGPSSEYAVGHLEGQVLLDSIKAAEQFAPAGLNAQTPVGINGYSGGAIATSWAASLQKTYAPHLNIVAIASGGTPADVVGIIDNIDNDAVANAAFFDVIYMAIVGTNRAYRDLSPILNAAGIAAATAMEDGCTGGNSDGSSGPSGTFATYTTQTTTSIDTAPSILDLATKFNLPQTGLNPVADTFVYHSVTDELIPIAGADHMVAAWCAAGSHVAYDRQATGGDHVTEELGNFQNVIAYMTSRFAGTATITPVGTTTCN